MDNSILTVFVIDSGKNEADSVKDLYLGTRYIEVFSDVPLFEISERIISLHVYFVGYSLFYQCFVQTLQQMDDGLYHTYLHVVSEN